MPGVSIGGSGSNTTQNVWIDYEFSLSDETAVYEFECVDVCGNVSEKSSFTVSPDNTENGALPDDPPNTGKAIEWNMTALDFLTYTVSGNSIRITGCDDTIEEIIIPDTIDGLPVTVIDWYAFENCNKLRSVTVPDTVTHISRFAFVHCISLETVNMPSALYSIEQYAFYDCPLLQGVKLPENLNIIEERAFYGCDSITEVTIPEACKSVGDYAFMDCENLDSITVTGNDTIFGSRSMGYVYENGYTIKDGFFIDADSGTAVTYAQENGIRLKKDIIHGDVNSDGAFSIADAVMLQKWILSAGDITDIYAADLNKDEKVNIADLCLMKAMLSA